MLVLPACSLSHNHPEISITPRFLLAFSSAGVPPATYRFAHINHHACREEMASCEDCSLIFQPSSLARQAALCCAVHDLRHSALVDTSVTWLACSCTVRAVCRGISRIIASMQHAMRTAYYIEYDAASPVEKSHKVGKTNLMW